VDVPGLAVPYGEHQQGTTADAPVNNKERSEIVARKAKGAALLAALEKEGNLFASPADVAGIMRRDIRTVYAGLERGEIPSIRVGQRYQISLAWIRRQVDGVPEPHPQMTH
jgi:hypothetical protein